MRSRATLTLLALSGCASLQTRLYPVCFYNVAPPVTAIEGKYVPELLGVMRMQATHDTAVRARATADARWVVARTTTAENEALARLWPRVSCIGSAKSGTAVKEEKDCVKYVNNFILQQNYLEFGEYTIQQTKYPHESPVEGTVVFCSAKPS